MKKDPRNLSRREFVQLAADATATSSLIASSSGVPKATAATQEHLLGVLLEADALGPVAVYEQNPRPTKRTLLAVTR